MTTEEAWQAEDRIGDLPDGILSSIVSRLSFGEAVRTSVLSARWRHVWTSASLYINDFYLNRDDCYPDRGISSYRDGRLCSRCWVIRTVDGILARHRGPIRGFHLTWSPPILCPCTHKKSYEQSFNMWVEILARRGADVRAVSLVYRPPPHILFTFASLRSLKLTEFHPRRCDMPLLPPNLVELKLVPTECLRDEMCALPESVASCRSLCRLTLENYDLYEPFGVEMPPNLQELRLNDCRVSDSLLSLVLSTCRSLGTLELDDCFGLKCVRINSPSLRKLTLSRTNTGDHSPFITQEELENLVTTVVEPYHLLVEDCPNLIEMVIDKQEPDPDSTVKIIKAPNLRSLGYDLNVGVIMLRQYGDVTDLTAHQIHSLKQLHVLDMEVTHGMVTSQADEKYWEQERSSNCLDDHLEVVRLKGFSKYSCRLHSFFRYLVKNARMLRVVFIPYFDVSLEWAETWIASNLPLEERASSDVRMVFVKELCWLSRDLAM